MCDQPDTETSTW